MIQISNIETYGWEASIRGMRNPMNSWEKSDSDYRHILSKRCDLYQVYSDNTLPNCSECEVERIINEHPTGFLLGPGDYSLMLKLAKAGSDHAKFRRMITVTMDILAPLYWWKEFDTYKVGTVANSCSTMHKIAEKRFTLDDFSHEHLFDRYGDPSMNLNYDQKYSTGILRDIVDVLNTFRIWYNETKDKKYWWQIIQLLPSSYNQLRTVQLNYEVLANIYKSRHEHKLDEWVDFCKTIEDLPYSEIITLKE